MIRILNNYGKYFVFQKSRDKKKALKAAGKLPAPTAAQKKKQRKKWKLNSRVYRAKKRGKNLFLFF